MFDVTLVDRTQADTPPIMETTTDTIKQAWAVFGEALGALLDPMLGEPAASVTIIPAGSGEYVITVTETAARQASGEYAVTIVAGE